MKPVQYYKIVHFNFYVYYIKYFWKPPLREGQTKSDQFESCLNKSNHNACASASSNDHENLFNFQEIDSPDPFQNSTKEKIIIVIFANNISSIFPFCIYIFIIYTSRETWSLMARQWQEMVNSPNTALVQWYGGSQEQMVNMRSTNSYIKVRYFNQHLLCKWKAFFEASNSATLILDPRFTQRGP